VFYPKRQRGHATRLLLLDVASTLACSLQTPRRASRRSGPSWSSSRTAQARSDSARVVTSAALFMIAVVSGFGPRDDPFP
jgi:hypothetical protein